MHGGSPEGDFGAVVGGGVPDSQQHRAVRQHVCPSVYVSQAQSAQPLTHLLLEPGGGCLSSLPMSYD